MAPPSVPTFTREPLPGPYLSGSLFLASARRLKSEYGYGILELFFPQALCICPYLKSSRAGIWSSLDTQHIHRPFS